MTPRQKEIVKLNLLKKRLENNDNKAVNKVYNNYVMKMIKGVDRK